MVNGRRYQVEQSKPPPPMEESWWQAVLAEDEAHYSAKNTLPMESNDQADATEGSEEEASVVDWDQAADQLAIRTPLTATDAVASIRLGAIGVDADTGREFRPGRQN